MPVQAIRVVCARYGHTPERITYYVREGETWAGMVSDLDPQPLMVEGRHRWPLRCPTCNINAPTAGMAKLAPILDRLAQAPEPAITRVSPSMIEVSLKLLADALGRTPVSRG